MPVPAPSWSCPRIPCGVKEKKDVIALFSASLRLLKARLAVCWLLPPTISRSKCQQPSVALP